jgi:FMN-dependent NADH-azoreductase
MKKILVINASPRGERSHSRNLTRLFLETLHQQHPGLDVVHREVGRADIPHITEQWIEAAFTRVQNRTAEHEHTLALSNQLVQELKDADTYILGTPMYNWGIPSGLKAYIDQVMRYNETWKFRSNQPDGDYVGLLEGKKLIILSSMGDSGYNEGEPNEHMNFQTTYLKTIFKIMGVDDVKVISLNNEEYGGERFAASQREVFEEIGEFSN